MLRLAQAVHAAKEFEDQRAASGHEVRNERRGQRCDLWNMVNDEFLVGLLESVYLPYSEAATAALFSLPTKTNARLSNNFDFVFLLPA